jgi:hypothetical protein
MSHQKQTLSSTPPSPLGRVGEGLIQTLRSPVERQLYCRSEHCRICNPAINFLLFPFDPVRVGRPDRPGITFKRQLQIALCSERQYNCRSTQGIEHATLPILGRVGEGLSHQKQTLSSTSPSPLGRVGEGLLQAIGELSPTDAEHSHIDAEQIRFYQ